MLRRQQLHHAILRSVRVLKLVHQHVLEAPLPVRQAVGKAGEQRQGMQQQIVEVHGIGLLQGGPEQGVHLGRGARQRPVGGRGELLR